MDYLGTTDYLTSPVSGKVEAWTHYNEWGLITHNAVLKCGQRELDLVKRYATHDYDSVLELYYAKARFYDAHDRRFTAVDPILDPSQYDLREYVQNPVQFVQYLYVENSPLIYVDYLGMFLPGTVLTEGASGIDIRMLNNYLITHNYRRPASGSKKRQDLDRLQYSKATTSAVKKFQKDNGLEETGTVDRATWEKMGFSVNTTLAQEFWEGKKGNDTINIVIEENDITINYSPKFYIYESTSQLVGQPHQGEYFKNAQFCHSPVSDEVYKEYLDRAVKGLKYWENDEVNIQGVYATVKVNVNPTKAEYKDTADIKLDLGLEGRGITWGAVGWTPGGAKGFQIPLGDNVYKSVHSNGVDSVSNIVAHEFGHVLGIMDAYPEVYNYKQVLSTDIVKKDGIMRSLYKIAPTFSDLEYEMILYAWLNSEMQSYFDGGEILAVKSQAFSR